jgi:hypothetical protein
MRTIYWFTAASILIFAAVVGWAAPTTYGGTPVAAVGISPVQTAKGLAVEEFEDFSVVFR